LIATLFLACSEDTPTPKPIGYFRIDLPAETYQRRNLEFCPFTVSISDQCRIEYTADRSDPKCWFNVDYPKFDAKLHLTYKPVDGNLREYIEESRNLTYEHQIKANRIETEVVVIPERELYGLIYDLGGSVASPVQFYLTDSTSHFLRGSLYFNARPNPDSIRPVLGFVRRDIEEFVKSLEWDKL